MDKSKMQCVLALPVDNFEDIKTDNNEPESLKFIIMEQKV